MDFTYAERLGDKNNNEFLIEVLLYLSTDE